MRFYSRPLLTEYWVLLTDFSGSPEKIQGSFDRTLGIFEGILAVVSLGRNEGLFDRILGSFEWLQCSFERTYFFADRIQGFRSRRRSDFKYLDLQIFVFRCISFVDRSFE